MASRDLYFGGIEGGGTRSRIVLMKGDGTVVGESQGAGTSHFQVGLDECLKRINQLIVEAKKVAGLSPDLPLKALGLSLSGIDSPEDRDKVEAGLRNQYPKSSEVYFVSCDTIGSIATACESGGLVLIAGTGSNCHLVNPNGEDFRCGGYGHAIGDEGSAYWITHYCLKKVFDTEDNFEVCPHDITFVRDTMCKHFEIDDKMDLLEYLYCKSDKASVIASMCQQLAKGAEAGDALCLEAFHIAGNMLSRHVVALAPKVDKSLLEKPGGLNIVTVGSVWKSFEFLKKGFLEGLEPRSPSDHNVITEISLLQLEKPASYGAAFLGAKTAGVCLPLDFSTHSRTFFHQKLQQI